MRLEGYGIPKKAHKYTPKRANNEQKDSYQVPERPRRGAPNAEDARGHSHERQMQ